MRLERWLQNYGGIALMWRGGCIIRSVFLGNIKAAYDNNPNLTNLLLDDFFRDAVHKCQVWPSFKQIDCRYKENEHVLWCTSSSTTIQHVHHFYRNMFKRNKDPITLKQRTWQSVSKWDWRICTLSSDKTFNILPNATFLTPNRPLGETLWPQPFKLECQRLVSPQPWLSTMDTGSVYQEFKTIHNT